MRLPYSLALAAILIVLPGCSFSGAPSWLQGDWIFDAVASQKAATETTKPQSDGLLGGMADAMGAMLLPLFTGMELRITDKEIMVTTSGNGKAIAYEVVSSIPDQECQLKQSDGLLVTYYKSGDEIYRYPDSGSSKIKLFFKRKA